MMNFTNKPIDSSICVPISEKNRIQAEKFAQHHPGPEKADQVRQNALAVLAVNEYLQWQNFTTDLQAGDSWSLVNQLCENVADLLVVGIGKLECRPILNLDEPLGISPEAWSARIGYVAVHLNSDFTEATLLGFIPPFNLENPIEAVPLSKLLSMDEFMNYLSSLEVSRITRLREWLEQVSQNWETPERLIAPFRRRARGDENFSKNRLEGAKRIELEQHFLVLVVEVERKEKSAGLEAQQSVESWDIFLQVYPLNEQELLPANLQMMIIDDVTGEVVMQEHSQLGDNSLELDLTCDSSDRFSVNLVLGDTTVKESFVI